MRILLINWARIWDGATSGGGVNGYCQSLALEFVSRGHDVSYLFGGVTCTPAPTIGCDRGGAPCEVRRHPDWLGMRVFEVVNSPVLAPCAFQYRNPERESESAELAAMVAGFVRRLRPQIVHFHNIEGFSADCIGAIREATGEGAAVLYSLHNYHTICPQGYLLKNYTSPCLDSEGGLACESCIDAPDPGAERAERERRYAQESGFVPLTIAESPRVEDPGVPDYAVRLAAVRSRTDVRTGTPPLPGVACGSELELAAALAPTGVERRGQSAHILSERSATSPPGPGDAAWRPLGNTVPDEPRVDPEDPRSNRYGVRRTRMIDALNRCDRVLAVSEFVRKRFEAAGVRADRLRVQHIGTKVNRTVDRLRDLVFDPPAFEPGRPRPIRLVFMGYNNVYKGLPMLAETLELMTPEFLSRFHLYLFAQSVQSIEWRFRRLEPRLAGLTVFNGYQPHDIPWMLGGKDLGVVPSVWWDNAPQTVFEFFACGVPLLAAEIGGIPDFVEEGRNGMLFRANDRFDLARRLAEVAREPGVLRQLRRNVRPPKDIGEHASELESVYSECLSSMRRTPESKPEVVVPSVVRPVGAAPSTERSLA